MFHHWYVTMWFCSELHFHCGAAIGFVQTYPDTYHIIWLYVRYGDLDQTSITVTGVSLFVPHSRMPYVINF